MSNNNRLGNERKK